MPLKPAPAYREETAYCASLVRSQDYDRYLCTLFAPVQVRESWFALFAFNQEIAAIPESVSDEMIGFMRFAWWREALDEVCEGRPVRRHPVVQALAEAVRAHNLPHAPLDALLAAREAHYAGDIPVEIPQWEAYLRATSGTLFALCAQAAGVKAGEKLDALGMAWGFTGIARAWALQDKRQEAAAFRQEGAKYLYKARGVEKAFWPFWHGLGFYLARLGNGKSAGRETSLQLLLSLGWASLKLKIGISKA